MNFYRNLSPKRVSGTFPSVILLSIRHFCFVERNAAVFAAAREKKKLKLIVVPAPFFHFTSASARKMEEERKMPKRKRTPYIFHDSWLHLASPASISFSPHFSRRFGLIRRMPRGKQTRKNVAKREDSAGFQWNPIRKPFLAGSIDGWLVPHLSTLRCLIKHARKSAEKKASTERSRGIPFMEPE